MTSFPTTDGGVSAPPPLVVAVDGPSGSGKSSVCREVARRLGLSYLDTGAMYRALCWSCLTTGVDLRDAPVVAARARALDIDLSMDPDVRRIFVDGVDATTAVRSSTVSMSVSEVARLAPVRAELVRRQQQLISAAPAGCIAEGRDVTTVVAPDADVRILLTADPEARIARRAIELHGHVHGDDGERQLVQTAAEVVGRDARDAEVVQFHEAGEGVVAIDTSQLTFDATVNRVLDEISARSRRGRSGLVSLDVPVGARGGA